MTMKKIISLTLMLSLFAVLFAGNISEKEAQRVAKNFLVENYAAQKIEIQLSDINLSFVQTDDNGEPVFYRFDIKNSGFIIVSATDLVSPILAYSFEGTYKPNPIADMYLNKYEKQIKAVKADNSRAFIEAKKSWSHYNVEKFNPEPQRATDYVDPLITTTWTQEKYYNTYCPYDQTISADRFDQHAVVGCVALNLANIRNYYRYPEVGIGGVSYYTATYDENGNPVYPRLEVMFANHHYNFDAIPRKAENYTGELAKLIYHCGVSARIAYGHGYGNDGTIDGSSGNDANALSAMKVNWGFSSKGVVLEAAPIVAGNNYPKWADTLKAELRQLHPIYFAATTAEGATGHAFLVDGFDNTGLFHINWGWEGYGNGFYQINFIVDPQGDGSVSYNTHESVIYNLYPAEQDAKPTSGTVRNTATRGCVTDGAGNLSYENNTEREWILAAPNARAYTFQFAKLKTEEDKDIVSFYNAATGTLLAEYSGHYLNIASGDVFSNYSGTINRPEGVFPDGVALPESFKLIADSIKVVFKTDAQNTDNGFLVYFDAELTPGPDCTPTPSGFITSAEGTLKDKDADGNYIGDKICEWRVKPAANLGLTKLTFAFNKFDLREGDFIDIFDMSQGDKPVRFARYDIYNMPNGAFTCNFTDIKVTFVADNWAEGEGFELQYGGTTEINENSGLQDVSIYPNPATDMINVALSSENDQNVCFRIIDMTGKVVMAESANHSAGSSTYQFSVNNLAKGFYFMNIETNSGKTIRKFIVE